MDSLESLLFGIFNSTGNEERIGHSIVGNYEVDTYYTVDQGYETAIWKTGNSWDMIIVQRYETKDEAIEGHSLWIEYCELNPRCAYSVQTEHAEMFKDRRELISNLKITQAIGGRAMRLIDEAALINEAETGNWDIDLKELKMILKYVPTIDAVPEMRGEWFDDENGTEWDSHQCSVCKKSSLREMIYEDDYDEGLDGEWFYLGKRENGIIEHLTNYCPNCGAKIEVEQK